MFKWRKLLYDRKILKSFLLRMRYIRTDFVGDQKGYTCLNLESKLKKGRHKPRRLHTGLFRQFHTM